MADAMLVLDRLGHGFAQQELFRGLSLRLNRGASVALVGPSGSGKSTILSLCLGMFAPQQGRVEVAGVDLATLRSGARTKHRSATTGVVFQFGELMPEISPVQNVALPALLARNDRDQAFERARELLEALGVAGEADAETGRLSGGERQRVAVARALINSPGLVLADEPTGSLDAGTREVVADRLFEVATEQDCALLVVTHDPAIAARADSVVDLSEFRVGERAEVGVR
ncbi:MAG: ABC transporter ATP-binding protein [Angustibacter sp.]